MKTGDGSRVPLFPRNIWICLKIFVSLHLNNKDGMLRLYFRVDSLFKLKMTSARPDSGIPLTLRYPLRLS